MKNIVRKPELLSKKIYKINLRNCKIPIFSEIMVAYSENARLPFSKE